MKLPYKIVKRSEFEDLEAQASQSVKNICATAEKISEVEEKRIRYRQRETFILGGMFVLLVIAIIVVEKPWQSRRIPTFSKSYGHL